MTTPFFPVGVPSDGQSLSIQDHFDNLELMMTEEPNSSLPDISVDPPKTTEDPTTNNQVSQADNSAAIVTGNDTPNQNEPIVISDDAEEDEGEPGEGLFMVEKILNHRIDTKKTVLFLCL